MPRRGVALPSTLPYQRMSMEAGCTTLVPPHTQIITFVDFGDMISEAVFDATSARLYDGWIMEPAFTGTLDALGALADLGPLIQADPAFNFADVHRFFREVRRPARLLLPGVVQRAGPLAARAR